jgi:hypothetical protein
MAGPTKAQINWTGVEWGTTSITRITTGGFSQGGKLLKFKADTDLYSTIIANVDNEPSATFTTADVGTVMGFVPGVVNTLTATLNDAKGASGGSVVFSMINAAFENADTTAQHAQFGAVTGTWQAFSSDGTTNPLSFTRV